MTAPYYADEGVTLYHGDALEVPAWLEADVLITDPPYGRGWRQGAIAGGTQGRTAGDASNPHAGIKGDTTTATRDAALALWGDRLAVVFGDLMLPPPEHTRQVLVYRKPSSAGVRGATAGRRRDLEAIYLIGPWPSGIGGASSLITTALANVADPNNRTGHPHAKPVDVMVELVGMTAGTIADPFAGSGSTLFAAKYVGRRAIGVEVDAGYCEIAARRLTQDTLFGVTP